jgi:hypothetical protein
MPAFTVDEAVKAAEELGGPIWVGGADPPADAVRAAESLARSLVRSGSALQRFSACSS